MDTLTFLVKGGIYAVMALGVLAALATVLLRNIFHSALALAATFVMVAGVYLALQAEFLAMVQILIYVGAIATLIIFAVMLTQRLSDKTLVHLNKQSLVVSAAALGLFVILAKIILSTNWLVQEATVNNRFSAGDLGYALMSEYIFPFEVIGMVLFAALIGAIVVARKDPGK